MLNITIIRKAKRTKRFYLVKVYQVRWRLLHSHRRVIYEIWLSFLEFSLAYKGPYTKRKGGDFLCF